ncbi:MAG: hypothetical protein AAGH64_10700, partial [Planctomycetota bacterium]
LCLVVGSRNSSNSVRLTEIAQAVGCPARLLDDVSELDRAWLEGKERVMITAGASAPEDLVAGLIKTIVEEYGAEIEVRDIFEEDVKFQVPVTLRRMMKDQGIDPNERRVHYKRPEITEEVYGTVPLTVKAS